MYSIPLLQQDHLFIDPPFNPLAVPVLFWTFEVMLFELEFEVDPDELFELPVIFPCRKFPDILFDELPNIWFDEFPDIWFEEFPDILFKEWVEFPKALCPLELLFELFELGAIVVLLDDTDGVKYDVFVLPIETVLLGFPDMVVMLEPEIKGFMEDVVKALVVGAFDVVGGTVVVDVDGKCVVNDMVVEGTVIVVGTVEVVVTPNIAVKINSSMI